MTRAIITGARRFSATDAVPGRVPAPGVGAASVDRLGRTSMRSSLPSVPTVPTLAAVAADPIGVNARLGHVLDVRQPARPLRRGGPRRHARVLSIGRRGARRFHAGGAGAAPTGSSSTWPTGTNGWSIARSAQRAPGIGSSAAPVVVERSASRAAGGGRGPSRRSATEPSTARAGRQARGAHDHRARVPARRARRHDAGQAGTRPRRHRRRGDRGRGVGHADRPSSARSSTGSPPRSPSASSNSPTARG